MDFSISQVDGETESPDLSLVYLPHLDYDLQRYGPESQKAEQAIKEIDALVGDLLNFYESLDIK